MTFARLKVLAAVVVYLLAALGTQMAYAQTPVVSGVSITSSPASGDTYELGERIIVRVTFDRPVDMTGFPQLALTIGSQTRQASWASAGGTRVGFAYSVQSSDSDTDGITIAANALTLNGGTIRIAGGTTDAALGLGGHAISNSSGHKVDGSLETAPAVNGVSITSSPASGDTYELGERIIVGVTFDRLVDVTGSPQLALTIGTATRQASSSYRAGYSWYFGYFVQSSDSDADGIGVAANALTLNGGTIRIAGGTTNAALGLGANAISDSSDHKVDGSLESAPAVNGVSITSSPASGDTYELGEQIIVGVTFDRLVDVTGSPQLALTIGTATRQASYYSGSSWLYFDYTVQSSDSDADGIGVAADALTLNGGTIRIAGGTTNATLGLGTHAISDSSDHKVDGSLESAPVVSGVSIIYSPVSGDTYELGERIEVEVSFDGGVDVTGSPQLALAIGTATRQASYYAVSGNSHSLFFEYTVQSSDSDTDGISIAADALTLNGGTIRIAGGTTNATLGLGTHAISDSSDHKVDGSRETVPAVSGVSITSTPDSGATYELGERITVLVTFDRPVNVTGSPELTLTIGSQTRQASWTNAGGTRVRFGYSVQSSDMDADGISIAANALTPNGSIKRFGSTSNAALSLGSHAISDSSGHKVDGSLESAPAVSGVSITSSPASGDTYELGERIIVRVTFDRPVDVTGSPQLALTIGTATRQASYSYRAGNRLYFDYFVQSSDSDADGIGVAADALTLNGGTIRIAGGTTNAALGLGANAISNSSGHKVDGSLETAPAADDVLIESSPDSGDTYELGERIEVSVKFDRPVAVTGTPQLALTIGSATRQASYYSGGSRRWLFFAYTVQSSDSDTDGITVAADALTLNAGTIRIAGGTTNAALGLGSHAISDSSGHKVDGSLETAPAVSGVSITSTPDSGDTYELGERIAVRVTFDRPVAVTGSPQLALAIGTATRQASYYADSGDSRSLFFEYTVQSSDSDTDGISIAANALMLNGGTIKRFGGTSNAALSLGTHAISDSSDHKVDGSRETVPAVSGVSITSTPDSGATYELGEEITVQVTFDRRVDLTGSPELTLTIGSQTRQASWTSAGRTWVRFGYSVQSSDMDADGISIAANALTPNGSIKRFGSTSNAALSLGSYAISDSSGHKVDGSRESAPAADDVVIDSIPDSGDTYELGERIVVSVKFDRAVAVTGTPQLALTIGSATRQASYYSGGSRRWLFFAYTVQSSDSDADGIAVAANALTLNGGTIRIAGGTATATLGLGANAISNSSGHKVDGSLESAPVVSGVSIISSPVSGDTYELAEEITVRVTFDRSVAVTDTPQLALTIGSATRQASYYSGSSRRWLFFAYTVQSSDSDTDGIAVAADALTLNAGTIRIAGGTTNAALGLGANAISDSSGHKVDGSLESAPVVSGVSIISSPVSGDTYELAEEITVRVTFDRSVAVTDTPQLALTIGSATRQASYFFGSRRWLFFRYFVQSSDNDADGIAVAANALTLNGGTIKHPGGTTDAALGLGGHAISNSSGHKVDGGSETAAAVVEVSASPPSNGATYEPGDEVVVYVWFDRAVAVTGTPQLALTFDRTADATGRAPLARAVGAAARQASCSVSAGFGGRRLECRYVVQPSDSGAVRVVVGALRGGTIKTSGGSMDANLDLNDAETSGPVVLQGGTGGEETQDETGSSTDDPPPGNRAPQAVGELADLTLDVGETASVDMASAFKDPDGDDLRYAASSDHEAVSASVAQGTLRLRGVRPGEATVAIEATDPDGLTATATFQVRVGVLLSLQANAAAPEGGTIVLRVESSREMAAPLGVRWRLATDSDPATSDADEADHGAAGGETTIPAGETVATIEIAIADDGDIEPAREYFIVEIERPVDPNVGLSRQARAVAAVQEGVCDRTPAVRDELARYHGRCWGPKPFDLSAVSRLDLRQRGIDALRPRDLAGLTGLRVLDLRGNDLATLPDALFADTPKLRSLHLSDNAFETLSAGMFAGLGQLREVAMDGNPGAPFALAVELSRTDAEPWAPAPATVSARIVSGAPFGLTVPLSAWPADAVAVEPPATAEIAVGAIAGDSFAAASIGDAALTLQAGAAPMPTRRCGDRPCLRGFETVPGPALTLFRRPPRSLAAPAIEPLRGDALRLPLESLIAAGDVPGGLRWRASSSDDSVATARVVGDDLVVEPSFGGEGTAKIALVATDAAGLQATLRFAVRVEFHWPFGPTRGWRGILGNAAGDPAPSAPLDARSTENAGRRVD